MDTKVTYYKAIAKALRSNDPNQAIELLNQYASIYGRMSVEDANQVVYRFYERAEESA